VDNVITREGFKITDQLAAKTVMQERPKSASTGGICPADGSHWRGLWAGSFPVGAGDRRSMIGGPIWRV